jgi:hypothetical protein
VSIRTRTLAVAAALAVAVTTAVAGGASAATHGHKPPTHGVPHKAKVHHVTAKERRWARGKHRTDPPKAQQRYTPKPSGHRVTTRAGVGITVDPYQIIKDLVNAFNDKQYIQDINNELEIVRSESDGRDAAVVFYLGQDYGHWDDNGYAYKQIEINGYKYGVIVYPENGGGFWYAQGYGAASYTSSYWGSTNPPQPDSSGTDPNFQHGNGYHGVDYVHWHHQVGRGAGNNGPRGNRPDNSWITIVNGSSGQAVDAPNGQVWDGHPVQSYNQHNPNEPSQGWYLWQSGDGYALLSHVSDQQMLNLNGGDNHTVQTYHWDGTSHDVWYFNGLGDSWYHIVNKAKPGYCLADNGFGHQLTVEPCDNNRQDQVWGTYEY